MDAYHNFPHLVPRPVSAIAKSYPSGYEGSLQSHPHAHFLYAESGTIKVTIDCGAWIVPPHRAVWFPPGYPHQMGTLSAVEIHILYIRPDTCSSDAPHKPCVLQVSPLLRELVRRATIMPVDYDEQGHDGKIMALLLDEIRWSPTRVPAMPRLQDRRLLAIERALASNPGDPRTLDQWAEVAAASPRTLARLFLREAGMSFRSWREQFRAVGSISRLMEGHSISLLSTEFGYETPSAFTAMFRRVMGVTPSQFLAEALGDRDAIPVSLARS